MDIIVCVKQVPDTLEVNVDSETNTLIRESVESVINPFDLNAIEEGLRLREQYGGSVTALSMGPPQAIAVLREALSMGVDEAVLLSDIAFAGSDTLATSYVLAKGVEKTGQFDLIICGRQAVDGDTAHVGPSMAERLGIPHVCCVLKIHVSIDSESDNPEDIHVNGVARVTDGSLITDRMTDKGLERIKLPLPALITVPKGINQPRFPSLIGKIDAVVSDIIIWSAQDIGADTDKIGLDGSATKVVKMTIPKHDRKGQILDGSLAEQVSTLLSELRQAETGVLQKSR